MKLFYNSYVVEPVTVMGNSVIVKVIEDYNLHKETNAIGTQHCVKYSSLEPLITEVFEIGDWVTAKDFTGRVVGYELHSNRAICISDKIERYKNDRVRYAYKYNEIKKLSLTVIDFEYDTYYKLNKNENIIVKCIRSPLDRKFVMLLKEDEKLFAHIPKRCDLKYLFAYYNIYSVEKLEQEVGCIEKN